MTIFCESIADSPQKGFQNTVAFEAELILILGVYFCILWILLAKRNFHPYKNVQAHVNGQQKTVINLKRYAVVGQ